MRGNGPTKVLIVDDSPFVRSTLTRVLADKDDIQVVGGAKDPFEARELIITYRPDVILLDIELPRMDGITFLSKLMKHYPVPVIMCSGVAPASSAAALRALELGAVEVVPKPSSGGSRALSQLGETLADKVRAAAIACPAPPPVPAPDKTRVQSFRHMGGDPNRYVMAIGASTGGTEAIRMLLAQVPPDSPPIVMVQHMPEGFTESFANRLDQLSDISVREAAEKDLLEPGVALLARGGMQMEVRNSAGKWRVVYTTNQPVNQHCPSVDVLFDSLARCSGRHLIGILLTGMGADGARGLFNLRQQGALTVGQDEGSCVVYGMPKVAVELGAVQHQAAPSSIPRLVFQSIRSAHTSPVT